MNTIISLDHNDMKKLLAGEAIEIQITQGIINSSHVYIKPAPGALAGLSEAFPDMVHTLIDEAVEKRNRSVSLYFNPNGGSSVSVYPWPDWEDLYQLYQDGKITFTDFRVKAGLPMIKEEGFLKSKHRFDKQFPQTQNQVPNEED